PPRPAVAVAPAAVEVPAAVPGRSLAGAEDWHRLIGELKLGGMANELAHHCELIGWDGQCLRLNLDVASQHVRVASAEARLRQALGQALGVDLRLEICLSRPEGETPAQRRRRQAAERQAEAQQTMQQDPVACAIREQFDAEWVSGSIKPSH
ncbi:DNA polymerase III subunit gamma/tau C-terminal domain-containing protein, partial [Thiococcus pfennigii]|uniref:DNA polymerase III subunit gamma/tau C-terminal domain-containing protein n=1 Tax=Thiococcus pfennigii TaxID=1057 RepID=UPI0023EEF60F